MNINYETEKSIGWLLSDIIDNLKDRHSTITLTDTDLYHIKRYLKHFEEEELGYNSMTIADNIKKINKII